MFVAMPRVTRPLTVDDFEQAVRLALEAFGDLHPGTPAPSPADWPGAGRHHWGTFDGGELVARIVGREYHSWFGGVEVPTNGIAAVTVVAEHRGTGLLDNLMRAILAEGRDRGEVISTLFPTAPGIYRRYGYELVTSYDSVEVPTAALAAVRPVEGITVRRAGAADFDAVRRVYDAWASGQNGPLTRRGASFQASADDFIAAFTGVTLALDESNEVVGYASWQRGSGHGDPATVAVSDLLATDARAYPALWRFLGGFGSVTGKVRIETSGRDVARLSLPTVAWQVVGTELYMLRVDDVPGAFSAIPLPGTADLAFVVTGDLLESMNGAYRLRVRDGATACERIEPVDGLPTFTPRGLALAYAGAQTCANIRMAGLLSGPTTHDNTLDTLLGGRPLHIRDYF
jgi:predicted acetyltransferase